MKRWAASIQFEKKKHHLGYFTDQIAAAKAYDKKASQLHGEYACLNFLPNQQQRGGALVLRSLGEGWKPPE